MNGSGLAFHYVCTRSEARELVARHDRFWVSNCGCREGRGECGRSRMDLCLVFRGDLSPSGSRMHEATRAEVEGILQEAADKFLVPRPFRNDENRSLVDGICFCCDDCCEYFTRPDENACDRGASIEETDLDACTGCGDCAGVCYFGARVMDDGELAIWRDKCYGCGLCVDACPAECIQMVRRR